MRVIVIDDNEVDRFLIRHLAKGLVKEGDAVHVVEFEDGIDALPYLQDSRQFGGDGEEGTVVLVDVRMPVMTGFELLEQLLEAAHLRKPAVRIHMVTSSENPADRARAKGSPLVADYLVKPLSRAHFRDIVVSAKAAAS